MSERKQTVSTYIQAQPAAVRPILRKIRATIRAAAPGAEERISYRIPAYFQEGVLVYFAAFKQHIGLYPPVRQGPLARAAARYAGPKGNLQFPLDGAIPHALIRRIVRSRLPKRSGR